MIKLEHLELVYLLLVGALEVVWIVQDRDLHDGAMHTLLQEFVSREIRHVLANRLIAATERGLVSLLPFEDFDFMERQLSGADGNRVRVLQPRLRGQLLFEHRLLIE